MRLKTIELFGFKSFAKKTVLTFEDDFVAIVGPNGSGKSNLSDAVRWVLGEQSAKVLRGSNMQEFIFGGTATKQAMNVCQVTLTFDNEDGTIPLPFQEVSVGRKVFRSGESQYFINKDLVCRRDVLELFFDTGVGKEGYSLIGQGRIDEILNAKGDDRRAVFEEAAGIAAFKFKKTEAARRLEKTERQLEEVRAELKVESAEARLLKKQAENAEEGERLRAALLCQEFSMYRKEAADGRERLQKILVERTAYAQEESTLHEAQRANEAALLPLQQVLSLVDEQRRAHAEQVAQEERVLQQEETRRSVAEEKRLFYQQEESRLELELAQGEAEMERLIQETTHLSSDIKNWREKEKKLQQTLTDTSSLETKVEETQRALQEARSVVQRLQQQQSVLHYRQEAQKKEAEEREGAQAALSRRIEALREEVKNALIAKENRANEQKLLETQYQETAQAAQDALEEMERAEKTRLELETMVREKTAEREGVRARHRLLSSLKDQYEGYNRAVQRLLQYADRHPEVKRHMRGSLADLIRVDEGYETAIEVALGGALQNIVVETEEDAKALIQILKQEKLGRVTFLPIDRIHGRKAVLTGFPEELKNGTDVVHADEELNDILAHFLAQTSLVATVDDAIRLSKRRGMANRIVSLEGEIINTWGSMVGGLARRKNETTLFNRGSELRRLEKRKEQLEQEILAAKEKASLCQQQHADANARRQGIKQEEETVLAQIRQLVDVETHARYEEEARQKELEQAEARYALPIQAVDLEEDARRLVARQDVAEKEEKAAEAVFLEAQQTLTSAREADLVKRHEMQTIAHDIAQAEERLLALDEAQIALKERQSDRRTQRENAARIARENLELIAESHAIDEKTRSSLLTWRMKREELEERTRQQRQDATRLEEERKKQENRLQWLSNAQYRLQLEENQLTEKEGQRQQALMDRYDLSAEEFATYLQASEAVEPYAETIRELRQALARIGYYNTESIAQYRTLADQVSFKEAQVEDLEVSRRNIIALIRELDGTMVELFKSKFDEINREYDRIFRLLFHGGKAALTLDGSDPLTAGVEIAAQPPGKTMQNLSLLSGGERSMTALALLFALFSVHPTPFCILDEIDAALDEANIDRFVQYLRTLRDWTQFIVITHRKTTMQLAETLYGVTMKDGISRVVQLRFAELEKEKETQETGAGLQ